MPSFREQGIITAAGVGAQVNQVLIDLGEACSFDCFLVAGRYTLLDQSAIDEVLPLCLRKSISVIIGSPYNTGILYDPKPDSTFDFMPAPPEMIEKALKLKAVCQKYNVPLPAAAIQFPFGHPAVAQVLTGAKAASEITDNLKLMQTPIPTELWLSAARQRSRSSEGALARRSIRLGLAGRSPIPPGRSLSLALAAFANRRSQSQPGRKYRDGFLGDQPGPRPPACRFSACWRWRPRASSAFSPKPFRLGYCRR